MRDRFLVIFSWPDKKHGRTEAGLPGESGWACLFHEFNDWRTAMSALASKSLLALVTCAGALGMGGCATKSYVREQIAPVSERVATLETRLQETDTTAKAALAEAQGNTQRIDQLTGRVDASDQRLTALEQRPARRARH
jgi:murein lipoprotein